MTSEELQAIVAKHELHIDGWHAGAGRFRDVYVGTGASRERLSALRLELQGLGFKGSVKLSVVDVKEHPEYGRAFLEIASFYW